jgi:putative transcriptional regulator
MTELRDQILRPETMKEISATGAIKSRPAAPMVPCPSRSDINVRRIRLASPTIGRTQQTFAAAIGVPLKTVSNWEQGRRKPTGPALVLLSLIARDPWIVFDVVNDQHEA